MKNIKKQIKLYTRRNQIHNDVNPMSFDKNIWKYIKETLKSHKKNLRQLFSIFLLISLIEIIILLILNIYLERFSYQLDLKNLFYIISFLFVILVSYIILNYFGIAKQKKLILDIINKVREDWLKFYLRKTSLSFNDRDEGNLYVKISYHLSLLQMGLNNSLFTLFQWFIFMFGILITMAFLDIRLLLISLAFIPINLIVFIISYILSAYYLSRDQTFYSKLLRYISDTFNSFRLVKMLKKEKEFLKNVNDIVEIDNYFRIKREIILKLGSKIIFVVLAIISAGTYVINIYRPFFTLDGRIESIIIILIFAFHIKLIHLSLRMGLFYFPLKLGIYLCVPRDVNSHENKKIFNIDSISFRAKKVKFTIDTDYKKNVVFNFEKGKSYLVRNTISFDGKLEHVFSGITSAFHGRNWAIKINNRDRLLYRAWLDADKPLYYINSNMYSEVSIFQFLSEKEDINFLKKYEVFNFIFEKKKFTGEKINHESFSHSDLYLMQVAHCLIEKPDIVIIESLFSDIGYSIIDQAFQVLRSELSSSIIISFSHLEKTKKQYDVIYSI